MLLSIVPIPLSMECHRTKVKCCPTFCSGKPNNQTQIKRYSPLTNIRSSHLVRFGNSRAGWCIVFPSCLAKVLTAARAELSPNASVAAVRAFVGKWFGPPGSDLLPWTPPDWTAAPPVLAVIRDPELRRWAGSLNARWKELGRRVDRSVQAEPSRHSLLWLEHGFVVPGGRFRESYYWDTLWIVRGLLVCNMTVTVRGMLRNFAIDLVGKLGFVPNGGRVYYTRRSQPPVLTLMVAEYFDATADLELIAEMLPHLDAEHRWWAANRAAPADTAFSQYRVNSSAPRPESYAEDWRTAAAAAAAAGGGQGGVYRARVWSELASGAETGWDYSSRWLRDKGAVASVASIATTEVVPVDLNAVLYRAELELARLHTAVGNTTAAAAHSLAAAQRGAAMTRLMRDPVTALWHDWNATAGARAPGLYAAAFVPFWAGLTDRSSAADKAKALAWLGAGEHGPGLFGWDSGVPTSLVRSGQQWDFPNVWPPLVWFAVQGLRRLATPAAETRATEIAQRYVCSAYAGWKSSANGFMYEKYDCRANGHSGSGGEYAPQNGFGWSNGVALELLEIYGATLNASCV